MQVRRSLDISFGQYVCLKLPFYRDCKIKGLHSYDVSALFSVVDTSMTYTTYQDYHASRQRPNTLVIEIVFKLLFAPLPLLEILIRFQLQISWLIVFKQLELLTATLQKLITRKGFHRYQPHATWNQQKQDFAESEPHAM